MRKYVSGMAATIALLAAAGAAFAGYGYSTPILLSGGTVDMVGGTVSGAALTAEFNFWYLPEDPGGYPTAGVWTDNTFPDYTNYSFDLNVAGGLVDMQNPSHSRSDAQWCIQSVWDHTIMAGTLTGLAYDAGTGVVSAMLIPYTSVIHFDGSIGVYGAAAYQGFEGDGGGERSGGTDFTIFRAEYDVATGTGVLTPAVPEPSSLAALAMGLLSFGGIVLKKRSA